MLITAYRKGLGWIFFSFLFPVLCYSQYLPENSYQTRNTRNVLEVIGRATGNIRGVPFLKITRDKHFIAEYNPDSREIIISEKLYRLCNEFGADSMNALACIVGHELAHFYDDTEYSVGFNEIIGLNSNPKISLENKKLTEAKADAFGLKYAYMAGFASYRLYPEVLNKIYKIFKVQNLPSYPTKVQRIGIASDQTNKILPLVYTFESAIFLQVKGAYDQAWVLYDYLLKSDFICAELLSNMGALKLAQVLKFFNFKNLSDWYFYPCEISPAERLRDGIQQRSLEYTESQKIEVLSDAEKYFREALKRDPYLVSAHINLITSDLLKGELVSAHYALNEFENLWLKNKRLLPPNFYLLKGITYALEGNFKEANGYMMLAKSNQAYQADANLQTYFFMKGAYKDLVASNTQDRITFLKDYFLKKSPASTLKAYPDFPTMTGDFSFRTLHHSDLNRVISNGQKRDPFYLAYDHPVAGLTKTKIDFKDRTVCLIRVGKEYSKNNPLGIKPGESVTKLEQFGIPRIGYKNSAKYNLLVFQKEPSDSYGFFVETEGNIIQSLTFFFVVSF